MEEGFTGETNNLSLTNTPTIGTQALPTIVSEQTNASPTTPSCAASPGSATPTTSVLIPANSASVSGTTTLDAAATKATGVGFYLFGGSYYGLLVGSATPTQYGWVYEWNTTTVPNGSYELFSKATGSGGSAVSSGVDITVSNPITSILIPANGASVSGTTTLDAAATNATGVGFYLFGGSYYGLLVGSATPTEYGWISKWNTTLVPNGSYELFSKATGSGSKRGQLRCQHHRQELTAPPRITNPTDNSARPPLNTEPESGVDHPATPRDPCRLSVPSRPLCMSCGQHPHAPLCLFRTGRSAVREGLRRKSASEGALLGSSCQRCPCNRLSAGPMWSRWSSGRSSGDPATRKGWDRSAGVGTPAGSPRSPS